MSKKLNEEVLGNELKASAFFAREQGYIPAPPIRVKYDKPQGAKAAPKSSEAAARQTKLPAPQEVEEQAVDQPLDQSTAQSTTRSTNVPAIDQTMILGRPKAFYITEKQDRDLDLLVLQISQKLGGKLLFKVDRSILIRLILESCDLSSELTVEKLSARLVSRSISQLTG